MTRVSFDEMKSTIKKAFTIAGMSEKKQMCVQEFIQNQAEMASIHMGSIVLKDSLNI
jgi:hypothetical protein